MTARRFFSVIFSVCAVFALLGPAPAVEAAATTETPVMGPSLLTADQLLRWYNSEGYTPRLPNLNNDVRALAQIFIDEGAFEGVRGDTAFVQAVLETGGFFYSDNGQIRPDFNNYGGINAFDGRPKGTTCAAETAPSRCFATPQIGVRNHIHLLRGYADPLTRGLPDRLRMPPSDRIGLAPIWELFGGNSTTGKLIWASAHDYGLRIIALYSEALVLNGARAACLPYFPGSNDTKTGNGYWVAMTDKTLYSFGSAQYHGNALGVNLNKPLINGEALSTGTGYWLLAEDGGVFTFGAAAFYGSMGGVRLNQPINGIERTDNNGGYWLVAFDGGIFSFGNAPFFGSTGALRLNQPVLGMERTASGNGYWLFARDGGIFAFGDAAFYGSLGGQALSAPIVSMQRTATGRGYWMLGADGKVYSFGDATNFGGIEGCANYFFATRLLVTPSGNGYWIATATGSVVAFGDARRLGFPSRVGGIPIALMLAP
ncbi:MAG: glucosaminidase domain-containing protein [Actinomycetota bacterium]|nr:glucosaminidase domain-containing protein [Actinomycetota bacterium]